jgi:hypothetical protein
MASAFFPKSFTHNLEKHFATSHHPLHGETLTQIYTQQHPFLPDVTENSCLPPYELHQKDCQIHHLFFKTHDVPLTAPQHIVLGFSIRAHAKNKIHRGTHNVNTYITLIKTNLHTQTC